MRSIIRNKGLWLVAVLAMLGLIFPSALASGSSTSTGNTLPDGGYLNLHFPDTNAAATFTQYSNSTYSTVLAGPQNVTAGSSCSVSGVNPGTPDLARVTPTGGTVGSETSGTKFVGLGVKGSSSSGTNCGRVEPGEALTVSLNGADLKLVGGAAATSLVATAAELDIDAKGNALVKADLAGPQNSTGFALLSTTAPSGDSGPDATSGDNFAFPINAGMPACAVDTQGNAVPPAAGQVCGKFTPFTSVKLSTSTRSSGSPSFALEGGRATDPRSNYTWDKYKLRATTADSVFRLQQATGVLNCGGTSGDVGGTGGTPTANVTRLQNSDSSTCTPVAYSLQTNADRSVAFQKDLTSQTTAAFTITITWPPELAQSPVPEDSWTQIQYEGGQYHNEQWCGGTTTAPTLPTDEFWCLTEQHTQIVGGGMIQVTEKSYGNGDPNYKRS